MLRWLRRKLGMVSPSRYYADAARRAMEEPCACGEAVAYMVVDVNGHRRWCGVCGRPIVAP